MREGLEYLSRLTFFGDKRRHALILKTSQLVYPVLPRRAIYTKARFEYRVSVIAAV